MIKEGRKVLFVRRGYLLLFTGILLGFIAFSAISMLYSFRALPFQTAEVIIKPKGKTDLEQDPQPESETQEKYKKCIIVLKGSVTIKIGKEKHILKKGDSTVFDSDNPHFFQNTTNRETSFLVIRNPKRF